VPFGLTFQTVDSAIEVSPVKKDGDRFTRGETIAELTGYNVPLLAAERVALNFLAHLSGIATLTGKFARELEGTNCQVLDTRKTTPGWRQLEKAAVTHGGGGNHRMGLYDMILIKDNHIAAAGSIAAAVDRTREYLRSADLQRQFNTRAELVEIEVEVTTESEVLEAIGAGVNRLLLDNQSLDSLQKLVTVARKADNAVKLEASGNVTLETIGTIARTGVDFISVGALTHSAPVADFSMRVKSRQS
jgi:nicotinate-nucleotide pyrophosphorylase (carboxylating)